MKDDGEHGRVLIQRSVLGFDENGRHVVHEPQSLPRVDQAPGGEGPPVRSDVHLVRGRDRARRVLEDAQRGLSGRRVYEHGHDEHQNTENDGRDVYGAVSRLVDL